MWGVAFGTQSRCSLGGYDLRVSRGSPALSALTVPLTSSLMRPSRMANTKVPNRNTTLSTSALAGGSSNRTAPRAGTLRPESRRKQV